jgi:hypothetical protein
MHGILKKGDLIENILVLLAKLCIKGDGFHVSLNKTKIKTGVTLGVTKILLNGNLCCCRWFCCCCLIDVWSIFKETSMVSQSFITRLTSGFYCFSSRAYTQTYATQIKN